MIIFKENLYIQNIFRTFALANYKLKYYACQNL